MKLIKIFSALLLVLAMTLPFFSCGNGSGEIPADTTVSDETSPADETTADPFEPKDITLIEDGAPVFTLVRPDQSTATELDAFNTIMKAVNDITGTYPKLVTDRFDTYDPEKVEIYVGDVSVSELTAARSTMAYNSYAVKVVGSKLVVAAWCDLGYKAAAIMLGNKLKLMYNSGSLVIPKDFELTGIVSGYSVAGEIPNYNYGTFNSVMNCADNTFITIIDDTTLDEFNSYTSSLSEKQYTLYTENNINDNIFRTYTREDNMLHAYYIPHSKQVRLIASDIANLPPKAAGTTVNTCTPTVTQLGISQYHAGASDEGPTIGGMGYVLRLSDGSFIIVDGGHNYIEDYQKLLKALEDQAPDKTHIVIRAWIITHFHSDHIGTFYYFAKQQSKNSKYEIQNFLLNTIAVAEQCSDTTGHVSLSTMKKPLEFIKQYYPNVPVYKPFAGEKFFYNDAVVNVLYTYDDFLPEMLDDDGNKTTMVVQIELGGQKLMFLGDTTKWNCDEMSLRYAQALKSDFVQMAHHGINKNSARAHNATTQIYQLIDPPYVFWPCNETAYQDRYGNQVNNYLLTMLHVKQLWVADNTSVTIELPYTGSGKVLH